MNVVYLLNHTFVGIFGMVLSAAFCDVAWTRRKRCIFLGGMVLLLLLQGIVYFFVSADLARCLYPITTHVPLMIILYFFSKKWLWSVISVFTAYLCCQIRRWIALLVIAVFSGGVAMQRITEMIVTLPLLLFFAFFIVASLCGLGEGAAGGCGGIGLIVGVAFAVGYNKKVKKSGGTPFTIIKIG